MPHQEKKNASANNWLTMFVKFLLQDQLLSIYCLWMLDLCVLYNIKWWMQKWNVWGKSTVKINPNIIVSLMLKKKKSMLSYPNICKAEKLLLLFFFFSFNCFKMLKYVVPSHSLTSFVWNKLGEGVKTTGFSAWYVYRHL